MPEITYKDCIKEGLILSLVFFLIVAVYVISQGAFITGGPFAMVVLGAGLVIGILIFTFLIFAPVVFLIKKYLLKY